MPTFAGNTTELSLTAATAKTIATLTATARMGEPALNATTLVMDGPIPTGRLRSVEISFKDATATDTPVTIELSKITTAGTGTTVTAANIACLDGTATPNVVFKRNLTVEPTYATEKALAWEVSPLGAVYPYLLPQDIIIELHGGPLPIAWGLRCTAAQNQTVEANLIWTE